MRLSIGIFYCVWLCCCINIDAHRLKRFIDADLHNRIDILSKSHDEHRTDTNWLRYFFLLLQRLLGLLYYYCSLLVAIYIGASDHFHASINHRMHLYHNL